MTYIIKVKGLVDVELETLVPDSYIAVNGETIAAVGPVT